MTDQRLDRDTLLVHYRGMHADMLDAIEGLSDEAMVDRSIDGWSVKDHLAHLALWDDIRASEVERISAGYASAWRLDGAQDEAINAVSYAARANLSLDQVRWEFQQSHERLIRALENITERACDPDLYGEAGLTSTHLAQHAGWIRTWRATRAQTA